MIFGKNLVKIRNEQACNKNSLNDYSTGLLFHSYNVGIISGSIAKKLKINNYRDLILMGNFHDLGKSRIKDCILNKEGKLTKQEFQEMKKHSIYSEEIILASLGKDGYYKNIAKAVRHHHENWDGTGYPDGLKGYEIPLESRILTIADVFDAIIHPRIYRKYTIEYPIKLMEMYCGVKFNEKIFNVAKPILTDFYTKLKNIK